MANSTPVDPFTAHKRKWFTIHELASFLRSMRNDPKSKRHAIKNEGYDEAVANLEGLTAKPTFPRL